MRKIASFVFFALLIAGLAHGQSISGPQSSGVGSLPGWYPTLHAANILGTTYQCVHADSTGLLTGTGVDCGSGGGGGGTLVLTTSGTSGAASLSGTTTQTLNIPVYATGPAGANLSLQYNNASAFDGVAIGSAGTFLESTSTGYIWAAGASGVSSVPLGGGLTQTQGIANSSPLTASSTGLFVQTYVNAYTGNHNVAASESGGLDVSTSGTNTFFLLAPTSTGNGSAPGNSYGFLNASSGALTLTITGAGAIVGCPLTSSSVVLSQYQNAWLTSDGTNYNCAESGAGSTSVTDTPVTLTISGSTFTPAMATAKNFTLALSHSSTGTLANPSTLPALGQSGNFNVVQSSSGGDALLLGTSYNTSNQMALSLSTTANAVDHFRYYAVDTTHIQIDPVVQNLSAASAPANNLALDGTSSSTSSVSSSPATVTLSSTTTNAEIIVVSRNNTTGTAGPITSISDTAGLSWALRKTVSGTGSNGMTEELWAAKAPSPLSSDVITVNYSGTVFTRVYAMAISGVNSSSPFDPNASLPGSNANASGATSITTGSAVSTTNANTLMLAAYDCSAASGCATPTTPAGFTNIFSVGGFSVDYEKFTSAQSSLTPTYSFSATTGGFQGILVDAVTQ